MVRKKSSLYSVHPIVSYTQSVIRNLPQRTGRSLEEWVSLLETGGPEGSKERRGWLRAEHGLGGTTAMLIAEHAEGKGREGSDPDEYLRAADEYVQAMYSGPRADLRRIHDALIEIALGLGDDVRVCPCKTIVPLYRENVFAEIKPATRKRIDLGLALKKSRRSPVKRLVETGGLERGDRITHRFAIKAVNEIDAQVRDWLEIAYSVND